ncbi:uncharacterized protein [Halyomorpha halys]|uniref:uncharacterized protein n=1 Tax=Halyomorpha halys TaxID=286706 RepID=UPI0006D50386|nr:uncharacterized protein LOC106681798 [Halyomorpha halys]
MENVICTVVQENTAEEFISVLNKYGVCTDYSNDYERSKAIKGIFVGVINKVYDVVWKGKGGHSEQDTFFISAKSLISNTRESQPFRVGFVGKIVSQLVEVNLKEGDAIGILKPSFFYALDVPTLFAGSESVVVWIAKDLKDSESNEVIDESPDESECLKKQRNGTANNRRRIPFIDEDSDARSLGTSSSSGTLQQNIQIFRSRPVELKRPEITANDKLVPDSTTRAVARGCQNILCTESNKTTENIVSQNTANVGSATDIPCRNEDQSNLICNLDSAVKSVQKDLSCSYHNVANNTCGMHSRATKCCACRVNCCNSHMAPANHFKDNCCSCNIKLSCACFNNQHCSCSRNSCCRHNALPQCMHWNSAHSCRTNNSSCNQHFDHPCRSIKSCCGPCHSQIKQCCTSHCQIGSMKSKHFRSQTNVDKTSTFCCNKQTTAPIRCHHLSCCNHENVNVKALHCCASRNELNSQHPKTDNCNEEMSVGVSEDTHKNSRTKEWIHNWVGDPPELLPDFESSDRLETSFQNQSLESDGIVETDKTCNNKKQCHLISPNPVVSSNPSAFVSKNSPEKHVAKKKRLFTPLDNSTIISAKSLYCNSTVIDESTPFDSENHTETPQDRGLSSDKNQESNDKNVSKNFNLPLSNDSILNNTLHITVTDPPGAKDANNSAALVGERPCPEVNAQESPIINKLQNEEILGGENRKSSEEDFPELRIETPIISQPFPEIQNDRNRIKTLNKTNQCESNMDDYVGVSSLKDNVSSDQHSKESSAVEEMNSLLEKIDNISNKESSFLTASDLHERTFDGEGDLGRSENCESNERNPVEVVSSINKNNKDNSCSISLTRQDHSKSRALSNIEEIDSRMDFTLMSDEAVDKEGMKRSKESSDDTMELTCESLLIKRRKKGKFRKTRSVCSGRNVNETCTSSFHDTRSDGILSLRPKEWCLKPVKELFDKPNFPLSQKVIAGLSLNSGSSYNLKLFSTFTVKGTIIDILPNLSQENYGNLVKGFCNEGCRKLYSFEDYKKMEPLNPSCSFCKYSYHVACPQCSKEGSKLALCLYFDFEIHLFDGENVLRIEVDHKGALDFLGCNPQYYLKGDTIYKKINKIIFPISQEKRVDPVLLKAKVKVISKSGATVLTLVGNTSLRIDLTFKGKHYKL